MGDVITATERCSLDAEGGASRTATTIGRRPADPSARRDERGGAAPGVDDARPHRRLAPRLRRRRRPPSAVRCLRRNPYFALTFTLDLDFPPLPLLFSLTIDVCPQIWRSSLALTLALSP